MGTIYKEVDNDILKDVPIITLSKTQVKISGIKKHINSNLRNVLVLVSIYSYYEAGIIARTITNRAGYYEFNFDKKKLSIGKYEIRYDGTGYRPALKPYGDWDVIEITKEMLQSGIQTFTNIIGVKNLKAYSNDGEKSGSIDGEHVFTNTIQLVWDDYRIMMPNTFPISVEDSEGNNLTLSYEQALTIENYIVFMFVNDEKTPPPNEYPIDNVSPSRWFLVHKTKMSEANIFLPNDKFFAFWVGGYVNENIFTETQQMRPVPGSDYQRLIY